MGIYNQKMDSNGDRKSKEQNGNPQIMSEKSTFEEAVVATGFGKFNVMLLFFIIPSSFSQALEQMAVAYVLPVAECDLKLTLQQKGLLNAIAFAGMISSGPLMGVICDTFGRRKLIVYGYFLHTLCSIAAATSTSVTQLLVAKFLCGFVFNGPFSAVTTFISEFHSSQFRARVQIIRGVTYALGFFILPILAWVILPLDINILLFGTITIRSWNLFLLCCASSPLAATILFFFMPESPKFLMSAGNNEEALKVFQTVFSLNSGKPKKDFPIKELVKENENSSDDPKKSLKASINDGWSKISPIFRSPYLQRLILAVSGALIILTSLHTIKLWLPQILQLSSDYQNAHNGSSTNVCTIISILNNKKNETTEDVCDVSINSSVYINSMIVNGVEILVFITSGFLVNRLGKKRLITILASIASICALGMYFAPNSAILITLFTVYIPALDLSGVMAMTITLEMFPTNFRTVALSFHLMSSRIGSLIANLLFSHLVGAGCLAPFLFCMLLTAAMPALICMYPNTENKALQ